MDIYVYLNIFCYINIRIFQMKQRVSSCQARLVLAFFTCSCSKINLKYAKKYLLCNHIYPPYTVWIIWIVCPLEMCNEADTQQAEPAFCPNDEKPLQFCPEVDTKTGRNTTPPPPTSCHSQYILGRVPPAWWTRGVADAPHLVLFALAPGSCNCLAKFYQ